MMCSHKSRMPLAGLILLALGLLLPTGGGAAELSTARQGVISANEAFYSAFRNRDMAAMDAVWSRNDAVAVIHPGWPGIVGRKQVMASWQMILEGGSPPKIRSVEPKVQVYGDTAFVVCYEQVDGGLLVATNIFVLEDDAWRMVHHQASPAPATAASGAGKKI